MPVQERTCCTVLYGALVGAYVLYCSTRLTVQDRQCGSAVSRVNRTVTCRGDVKERWANVQYVLQCEKTLTDTHVRLVRAIGTVVYGTVQYKTETGLR